MRCQKIMRECVLNAPESSTLVSGVAGPAVPAVIQALFSSSKKNLAIVVCGKTGDAENWAETLAFFDKAFGDGSLEILILPPGDDSGDDARAFDIRCERLDTLARMAAKGREKTQAVIFTTPAGLLHPVEPADSLVKAELSVKPGLRIAPAALAERLATEMGYDHEPLCENPGQYALRGGILDVYPFNATAPVRIDFFGDDIDSVRAFDPTSQRTTATLESATIAPMRATASAHADGRHILGYLGKSAVWFFEEPDELAAKYPEAFTTLERGVGKASFEDIFAARALSDLWYGFSALADKPTLFGSGAKLIEVRAEATADHLPATPGGVLGIDRVASEESARRAMLKELAQWRNEGWKVLFVPQNEGEADRLKTLAAELPEWKDSVPDCMPGPLRRGFRLSGVPWKPLKGTKGIALVPAAEVFGTVKPRPAGLRRRLLPRKTQVDQALDFSELAPGDPLHLRFGRGAAMAEVRRVFRDAPGEER